MQESDVSKNVYEKAPRRKIVTRIHSSSYGATTNIADRYRLGEI
jgi:hypothetical protein